VIGLCSFGSSWDLNYQNFTDDAEPYVYVQTFTDINELLDPLRALARRDPLNYLLRGHFVLAEQYPFNWLLADFPRVDYLAADELPDPLDADFLVVDNEHVDQIEPLLRAEYFKTPMRIRGNSDSAAALYLDRRTFTGWVPADYPIFEPAAGKLP
jgi:hypothetical protein